jgi:hypothetical protein
LKELSTYLSQSPLDFLLHPLIERERERREGREIPCPKPKQTVGRLDQVGEETRPKKKEGNSRRKVTNQESATTFDMWLLVADAQLMCLGVGISCHFL